MKPSSLNSTGPLHNPHNHHQISDCQVLYPGFVFDLLSLSCLILAAIAPCYSQLMILSFSSSDRCLPFQLILSHSCCALL